MKRCNGCGERKPLADFYSRAAKCKECTKISVRQNYAARREQYSAYERRREQTPERRAAKAEYARRHRKNNPDKYGARTAVSNALRDGRLARQPCKVCGGRAQAHHADYGKPLEVDWLCFRDHRELEHGQVVSLT